MHWTTAWLGGLRRERILLAPQGCFQTIHFPSLLPSWKCCQQTLQPLSSLTMTVSCPGQSLQCHSVIIMVTWYQPPIGNLLSASELVPHLPEPLTAKPFPGTPCPAPSRSSAAHGPGHPTPMTPPRLTLSLVPAHCSASRPYFSPFSWTVTPGSVYPVPSRHQSCTYSVGVAEKHPAMPTGHSRSPTSGDRCATRIPAACPHHPGPSSTTAQAPNSSSMVLAGNR